MTVANMTLRNRVK